jgi:hypothetical protein
MRRSGGPVVRRALAVLIIWQAGACSSGSKSTATGGTGGTVTGGAGGIATGGTGGARTGGTGGSLPGTGGTGGSADAGASLDAAAEASAALDATPDVAPDTAPAPCSPGSSWTVVDDYTYSATAAQTNPAAITVSPSGELYATGITPNMGNAIGLLRKSSNGTSWMLLKEQKGIGSDIAVAPGGTFFASGGSDTGRAVSRSRDGGLTWQIVDTVPYALATACGTGAVAIDSKGVIYAAGSCDAEGWVVRRSTDGGDHWSLVGAPYQLAAGKAARLADLRIDAADRVFVSGTAQDMTDVAHWIVRRLDGDTWTVSDDFQPQPGAGGVAPRLAGTTRLYAVGTLETGPTKHWIVRRLGSGGTWSTIDDYVLPGATILGASGLHEGPGGKLVAVGWVTDAASVTRTITRRSPDDGATWMGTEEWTFSPGKSSQPAGGLVADRAGNVYGTVRGVDSDNRAHWLVRGLACAP